MLDLIRCLDALSTQLAIHLLVGHLSLQEATIKRQELSVVLDQLESHFEIECLIP